MRLTNAEKNLIRKNRLQKSNETVKEILLISYTVFEAKQLMDSASDTDSFDWNRHPILVAAKIVSRWG